MAEQCIEAGAHYLDLADARDFVAGIGRLDEDARRRGLLVASGVSSTPAITSAMIAELAPSSPRSRKSTPHFRRAIRTRAAPPRSRPFRATWGGRSASSATANGSNGRAGATCNVSSFPPPVGRRRVHNCEVPELELFPQAFGARTVRFSAGLELNLLNYLLSLCALPCRWFGLDLTRRARFFLNVSLMLFPLGTTNGSLAIWVRGRDHAGQPVERRIALVTDYDGPATPSSAAVVLARKILNFGPPRIGAFPCVGLLSLDELLAHLHPLGIWCARGDESGWSVPVGSSHETI